eukprot:1013078-Pyramimonas_sp.AAC.1
MSRIVLLATTPPRVRARRSAPLRCRRAEPESVLKSVSSNCFNVECEQASSPVSVHHPCKSSGNKRASPSPLLPRPRGSLLLRIRWGPCVSVSLRSRFGSGRC